MNREDARLPLKCDHETGYEQGFVNSREGNDLYCIIRDNALRPDLTEPFLSLLRVSPYI